MASKKLQTTVEEPLLVEMEERMKKEKFYETSEFLKHCLRTYLLKSEDNRAPTGQPTEASELHELFTHNQLAWA